MGKYPLNPADSVSIILIVIACIFFYIGLTQDHTGYIVLGGLEVALAIIQSIVNRSDIVVS